MKISWEIAILFLGLAAAGCASQDVADGAVPAEVGRPPDSISIAATADAGTEVERFEVTDTVADEIIAAEIKKGAAHLQISVAGLTQVNKSQVAVYRVSLENIGTVKISGITTRYRLPAIVMRMDVPESVTVEENGDLVSLIWDIAELGPGQRQSMLYSFKTEAGGSFSHLVEVDIDKVRHCRRSFEVHAVFPVLKLKKEGPAAVTVGEIVNYFITVRNSGDGPAREVMLADTLPPELEYVYSNPSGVLKASATSNVVLWELGDIHPKTQLIIQVQAKAKLAGTSSNSARLISSLSPLEAIAITEISE